LTKTLPILPTLVGLVLILMSYHFDIDPLGVIGALYLGYGTIIHIRNVKLVREHYNKQRIIL